MMTWIFPSIAALVLLTATAMANERKPPMSEIFDAMAKGVMAPYDCNGCTFSATSYDLAKEQQGIYHAIAEVYRKYEGGAP